MSKPRYRIMGDSQGASESDIGAMMQGLTAIKVAFLDTPEHLHASLLVSGVISILMALSQDPAKAWDMVRAEINDKLAISIAMQESQGEA